MRAGLEEAIAAYEKQLPGTAGQALLEKRGIMSAAREYRLGFVAEALPGDQHLTGRIVIPYQTPAGPVSIRLRTTDGDAKPKYLPYRAGMLGRPFNVMALLRPGPVYVCEGEIDAISATVAGLPAVGFSGSAAWKPVYARIFRFRDVTVLADGDEAGWEFAQTVAADLEGCKINSMPPLMDVNSVLVERGIDGLRKLVGADD